MNITKPRFVQILGGRWDGMMIGIEQFVYPGHHGPNQQARIRFKFLEDAAGNIANGMHLTAEEMIIMGKFEIIENTVTHCTLTGVIFPT